MAYVPGYEHDIFVSYAHVDNEPPIGVEHGWVTALISNLEKRLAQLLGRRESFELWIDHEMARHVRITPQTLGTLERTAILLVILSPGYLASEWCEREREAFLQANKGRIDSGSSSCLFIVERDKVELEERPEEFAELLGYRFWEDLENEGPRILGDPAPGPDDRAYYTSLDRLARELCKELKRLLKSPVKPDPTISVHRADDHAGRFTDSVQARHTVYLAEVTDDLVELREEIKVHLDQFDFRVLPDVWYSRDASEFEASVKRDLGQAILFVQPLGSFPGKKPPGSSISYSALQYQAALTLRKPMLQWRSPALDLNAIADPAHRRLLQGCQVHAVDIADFKREVIRCAQQEIQRISVAHDQSKRANQLLIFINSVNEDRQQAESLAEVLNQRGCAWALPKHEGRPEEIRKDLEANLLDCDGVIVVYGQITNVWVRDQLRQCQKMTWRRDKPLRAVAIYETPPEPKDPVDMRLQNLQVLKHRQGRDEESLTPFLSAIGAA